jgi:peptidoglycan hydrolase-like protein with peptidoglycan-binding domain
VICRRIAALLATVACAAVLVGSASAETTATPAPAPAPSATPAPAPGQVRLTFQRVGGRPPFALVGRRIVVRGVVAPYVAGQSVSVGFYVDGHPMGTKVVSVLAGSSGAGSFQAGFTSNYAGLLQARVVHAATAQQSAFGARLSGVRYVHADLGLGARGESVRLLQSELNALHYAVPLTGVLDEGTGQALIAYRKMTGLSRIPYAGTRVFELLARHAGGFHVRYRGDGRHVEANLTRQVLAEIEPGGRVRKIYTTSSGKPSTPTVLGRFQVYLKTPGENSEGMVDSNYFIRGYAIHGYAEVPTYAASHGCLRVPIPDAPAIYAWVQTGTPVDVYYE